MAIKHFLFILFIKLELVEPDETIFSLENL